MNHLETTTDFEHLQSELADERRARLLAERTLAAKSVELEQAEATLREQLERSRAVLQHAAEGVITFNAEGVVESLNPAAERIFDYESSSAVGLGYKQLFSGPTLQDVPFDNWTEYLMSTKHVLNRSHVFGIRSDGTQFPVDVVASRVRLADKTLVTAIVRDMTQRLELERQLSHAQKMESIGQLAAGIAHEINTPIQYVGDNCRFLRDAFDDLNTLIQAYLELERAVAGNAPTKACSERIASTLGQIDLEFLRSEVPSAISQSIDGTERVAQIVRAMKDFSHPGNQEKTPININAAIESTVTVCRNEWKYVADVETDFDPNLPLLPCLPGELNQTFLNLIVNSAHAIKEKLGENATDKGVIHIRSRQDGNWIELRFRDTGTGIPESIRDKIFDPFFTTKGVGRGTGQGLAISYSAIVEKHQGEVKVESEIGVGTTFVIRLPLLSENESKTNGTPS